MNQLIAFALLMWLIFMALTGYMAWEKYRAWKKRQRFEWQLRRWQS